MKINNISLYKPFTTQKINKNNPIKNYQTQTFAGVFDVFKKQNDKPLTEEEIKSKNISQVFESAKRGYKSLQKSGKVFSKELNYLLRLGAGKDYKGGFPYLNREGKMSNVTFSEFDEELNVPTFVNLWTDGKPKSVYEIYLVKPQSLFHLTSFGEDSVTEFNFAGANLLEYLYKTNSGDAIMIYPSDDGFIQRYGKQINNNESFLMSELYYDKKHPEKSYYIENGETELTKYEFDKEKNLWIKTGTISQSDFDAEED